MHSQIKELLYMEQSLNLKSDQTNRYFDLF